MKALSLWQPHALAIGLGLKPWETRDWAMSYRGTLAIHAAKRPWKDKDPWSLLALRLLLKKLFPSLADVGYDAAMCLLHPWLAYGAVQCVVNVADCRRTSELRGKIPAAHEFWGDFSDGETGKGRYASRLENVRMLERPIPWRGKQGFFDVNLGDVIAPPPQPPALPLFEEMR